MTNNLPFYNNVAVRNPPFPLGFSGPAGTAGTPVPDGIDFDLQVPTRLQYSFGLQRQVTSSSVFSVGYVGSHSYHLTRQSDGNTAVPQILPGGIYFYPAGAPRTQPALGAVRFVSADADGWYNSLQLDFIQRPTHGVRYKVSYTFAKNMDEDSANVRDFADGAPWGVQNPFNRRADRGL